MGPSIVLEKQIGVGYITYKFVSLLLVATLLETPLAKVVAFQGNGLEPLEREGQSTFHWIESMLIFDRTKTESACGQCYDMGLNRHIQFLQHLK